MLYEGGSKTPFWEGVIREVFHPPPPWRPLKKTLLGRAHNNGGVQQRPLLRRVLRRVLETASEKVLRRVLRRCLAVGFNGKKGSEKGS